MMKCYIFWEQMGRFMELFREEICIDIMKIK